MKFNSPTVALEGFEPPQAEPESDVLPLHHKAIPNRKLRTYFKELICNLY